MAEARFEFATQVSDGDGVIGQFTRVIFDPADQVASHVVVIPDDVGVTARLVPIATVDIDLSSRLVLRCSRSEFLAFEDAVEYETLPYSPGADVVTTMLAGNRAMGLGGPAVASFDRIPEGKVALSRDQAVMALDGRVGQAAGVVVDLNDHRLTKLVVGEGHLWSKKLVTLPIGSVKQVADEVQLGISMQQAHAAAEAHP